MVASQNQIEAVTRTVCGCADARERASPERFVSEQHSARKRSIAYTRGEVVISRGVMAVVLALSAVVDAAQESGEARPRDAAEAVREGDVSQWLKYYQRERDMQPQTQQPAGTPEPAAGAVGEDAGSKR